MFWTPRRLRARTLLSYLPALLVTIVAAILVSHAFSRAQRYSDQVLASTRFLSIANELRARMATAQSAVRGFAITGDESYLEPYHDAETALRTRFETLNEVWAARPHLQERVTRALRLFFEWRETIAEPVIEARRPPAAETIHLIVRGNPLMDQADRLVAEVVREERELLQVRTEQNNAAARWGMLVAIGAPLIALGYVLLASYWVTRRTVGAIESVSRAAQDLAAGDLSRRVSEEGSDEVAAMGRSFNLMAKRLEERTVQAQRLVELTQLLQVSLTTEEIGAIFELYAPKLVPASGGCLYLLPGGERTFLPQAWWGDVPHRPFPPTACWAVRLGKTYESAGTKGPRCEHIEPLEGRSSVCIPMVVNGESLGLIQYTYALDQDAKAVLRSGSEVAERFAFTTSNLALRERLREQSVRDPLTGLFNRRYLDEMLEREIERARRFEQPLGVLMLDIDHFKELNDVEGHEVGDAVLREFGRLLASGFRTGDEAFRYGGEEFVVLMPDACAQDVVERAEGLREVLRKLRVQVGGRTVGPVTASMGVSAFPADGSTAAELLRAADQALYGAKEAGRDRIIDHASLAPPAARPH